MTSNKLEAAAAGNGYLEVHGAISPFSVFENAYNKEFNNNTCFHGAYHVYSVLSINEK